MTGPIDIRRFPPLSYPLPAGTMTRQALPRHARGELFLKGPIPMTWLQRAMGLPGRALHVGLAIWFQAGMKRRPDVKLSLSGLQAVGVQRSTASRALKSLEGAGLVSVVRAPGKKPVVTLLNAPTSVSAAPYEE